MPDSPSQRIFFWDFLELHLGPEVLSKTLLLESGQPQQQQQQQQQQEQQEQQQQQQQQQQQLHNHHSQNGHRHHCPHPHHPPPLIMIFINAGNNCCRRQQSHCSIKPNNYHVVPSFSAGLCAKLKLALPVLPLSFLNSNSTSASKKQGVGSMYSSVEARYGTCSQRRWSRWIGQ